MEVPWRTSLRILCGDWLLAVPAIAVFAALYLAACFATSRWLEEGRD